MISGDHGANPPIRKCFIQKVPDRLSAISWNSIVYIDCQDYVKISILPNYDYTEASEMNAISKNSGLRLLQIYSLGMYREDLKHHLERN